MAKKPKARITSGVGTVHPDYTDMLPKWKRCRDVVSGRDAIHNAGEEYLPKLRDENLIDYKARLMRSTFFNASWRTIAGFIGMLYRKPPTLEVPAQLEELLKDVTMSGVDFKSFAQDCTLEDLVTSRLGVLVDHPMSVPKPDGTPLTVAEADAQGLRPNMKQYKAESIINWRYGRVNNKTVLVQVRLLENNSKPLNEFEDEVKAQIRVLDLIDGVYRQRLFDADTGDKVGNDIIPLLDDKPLDEIPFYFIGPDGTEANVDDPILIDLFDLNLDHYRVSSDYEYGCHYTGLPTPYISGYTDTAMDPATGAVKAQEFYIGSSKLWVFADPNAKADYLEFKGEGLGALEKNMDRKEAQMAAVGARMLAPEKTGVEAAETLAMRHSGENSILAAIAIAVSQGLTKALIMFAKWAGVSGEIKFEINREFIPIASDPQRLTAWLALVQGGRLSGESFFNLLKRADLVDAEESYADEQARIDSQTPPAPVAANPANPEPKPNENKFPKAA